MALDTQWDERYRLIWYHVILFKGEVPRPNGLSRCRGWLYSSYLKLL